VKLWDLKGSSFTSSQTFYDHEEEVVSAHSSQNILATMDVEGNIIIRDLRTNDIISNIKLDNNYETGQVLLNDKRKDELFVFSNCDLGLYYISGD
jgi:WD40 repeat protein